MGGVAGRLACLVPAVAIAGLTAWLQVRPAHRLLQTGRRTAATITLVSCKAPPVVRYVFDADGRTYYASTDPTAFAIPCPDLQIGAQVPIAYLPGDPATSAGLAGLEQTQRAGWFATAAGFLLVFTGMGTLLWARARSGRASPSRARPNRRLTAVKSAHTLVWALFVGLILAVWVSALLGRYEQALLFGGLVAIECLVLLVNQWKCPLTAIAARYTPDRRANFDIYLPEWLARYNKEIFGPLFALGLLFTLLRWLGLVG